MRSVEALRAHACVISHAVPEQPPPPNVSASLHTARFTVKETEGASCLTDGVHPTQAHRQQTTKQETRATREQGAQWVWPPELPMGVKVT